MRLCLERILPPCRERAVKFAVPPIESAPTGQSPWAKGPRYLCRDAGGHLGARGGAITPGEAATIATVVDTFVRAIDTTKRRAFAVDPLQIVPFGDFDETYDCDS